MFSLPAGGCCGRFTRALMDEGVNEVKATRKRGGDWVAWFPERYTVTGPRRQWCDDPRAEFAWTNRLCLDLVASSAGNMHSSRNSSAVTVCGVPTVVIIEK